MKLWLPLLLVLSVWTAQTSARVRGEAEVHVRDLGADDIISIDDQFVVDDDTLCNPDLYPNGCKPKKPGNDTCFSVLSTVQERTKGTVAMKDLQIGDRILTKSGTYQTVFAFAHREVDQPSSFIQFHSQLENPLEITKDHLVYLHNKPNPVRAESVRVGDQLHTLHGPASVTKITTVHRVGVYAPMTIDGTLVVDSVAASNYISFQKETQESIELFGWNTGLSHHDYVHMGMSPFRLICLGVSSRFAHWWDEENGMPLHVSLGVKANNWLFRKTTSRIARVAILALIILVHGACWMLECTFGPAVAPLALFVLGVLYYNLWRRRSSAKNIKIL